MWSQVRDACFVGPEGHPLGTGRLNNAAGYPPNLRRPQGDEPGIHQADPRPRCFRCSLFGHFMNMCTTIVSLKKDINAPRHVYLNHMRANHSHVATSAAPLLDNPARTPHREAQQKHQQQS